MMTDPLNILLGAWLYIMLAALALAAFGFLAVWICSLFGSRRRGK